MTVPRLNPRVDIWHIKILLWLHMFFQMVLEKSLQRYALKKKGIRCYSLSDRYFGMLNGEKGYLDNPFNSLVTIVADSADDKRSLVLEINDEGRVFFSRYRINQKEKSLLKRAEMIDYDDSMMLTGALRRMKTEINAPTEKH